MARELPLSFGLVGGLGFWSLGLIVVATSACESLVVILLILLMEKVRMLGGWNEGVA